MLRVTRRQGDDAKRFLIQVVHLYAQRGMTQQQVADLLGVSKMTVSRALKRAEREGLIETRIRLPVLNDPKLQDSLRLRLGIGEVFVVSPPVEQDTSSPLEGDALLDLLGQGTALFVEAFLRDAMVLGIALGRTVSYVVNHLPPRRLSQAKVVQIMGGLGTSSAWNPYNLVQSASQRLGAQGVYFAGPAFVADARVREALLAENATAGVQALWKQCDLCLVGIGTCSLDSAYVAAGLISTSDIEEVAARGAVGDIVGYYYDIDGRFIESSLHARLNAMPLSDLQAAKRVVVTAGGRDKVEAIIGVARTGIPSALVTDGATARAVVRALDASARGN